MKTLVRTLSLLTAVTVLTAGMAFAADAPKMGDAKPMAKKGGMKKGHKKGHKKAGKMSKKGGKMGKMAAPKKM